MVSAMAGHGKWREIGKARQGRSDLAGIGKPWLAPWHCWSDHGITNLLHTVWTKRRYSWFADGLALNSLAPCAATAIYWRRCKLPYFTVLGWEMVQIYTGFAVSLFGVFGSLYICCHIRFTFWQPCWDKKILSDGADSVWAFFLNILAHFLSFHGQANVRERPKTHIWHLLERLISVFWISWYV